MNERIAVMATRSDEPVLEPPARPPDQGAPGRGRRRWPLALGLALAAVLAAAAGWIVQRDDGDGGRSGNMAGPRDRTSVSLPPPVSALPDAEGSELLALLKAGRARTFHAKYDASGPNIGGKLTLELFRKQGKLRQDTRLESEAGVTLTAGFALGGNTTVSCTKRGAEPWVCARSAGSAETALDGVFGSIAAELAGVDVTVEDSTAAGRQARCFRFPTRDGQGSLCLTAEGIPVRASVNGTEMTLSEFTESVNDDVFRPPAAPVEA